MDDLTAFTVARLDEDKARATALQQFARETIERLTEPRLLGREIPGWHSWPDVDAMCTRTLADVAAKRAIVLDYAAVADYDTPDPEPEFACGRAVGLGEAVRTMAASWSDHHDYQPEWAQRDHGR